MLRTFSIPPESARCPLCGPNPEFIIIDGQPLGCTDPDDVNPKRLDLDCPVLDIPTHKLCIVENAQLRAAITKVLCSSAALTDNQVQLLRTWHADMTVEQVPVAERAAAVFFFHFFPLRSRPSVAGTTGTKQSQADTNRVVEAPPTSTPGGHRKRKVPGGRTLEEAVRQDDKGNLVLGGRGPIAKRVIDAWRELTGVCAPRFERYPRDDDGAWLAVLPFLQTPSSKPSSPSP